VKPLPERVVLAARIFLVLSGLAFMVAIYGFSARCGDTCPDSGPGSWWQSYDSWQWTAEFVLAGSAFVLGATSVSPLKNKRLVGALLLSSAVLFEAVWIVMLLPGIV
jgi:hypothetical protein